VATVLTGLIPLPFIPGKIASKLNWLNPCFWLSLCLSSSSHYQVQFPLESTPDERTKILGTSLYIASILEQQRMGNIN